MMKLCWKQTIALTTALGIAFVSAPTIAEQSPPKDSRTPLRVDFIGAANLPGLDGIAVVGLYGMVGMLKLEDGTWKLHRLENPPKEDFTAVTAFSDTEALVGSSTGHLYLFDGKSLTEVAKLSEFSEPILDIEASNGKAWAVGARGILAKSPDGHAWEEVEVSDVVQPLITWRKGHVADWYFGASNIDADSVKFTATVGGEPAVEDEHYTMFPDEGFIQTTTALDMDVPPTIEFTFNPGPPFRAGDVSWNTVLFDGQKVTIAGEFGMVLQSEDGGATWVRRNTKLVDREPEPSYWLASVQKGETMYLAGAAGVSSMSTDGGVTWTVQPRPGNEGIFGIALLDSGEPLIAGAVGLLGTYTNNAWALADRTQLKLLSWLKNPVPLTDGSVLMLGGRSTAISFKDGTWTRVPVDVR
jgi:hypothetical protein